MTVLDENADKIICPKIKKASIMKAFLKVFESGLKHKQPKHLLKVMNIFREMFRLHKKHYTSFHLFYFAQHDGVR